MQVPQQPLEFVLVAFGAVVGWEGETSPLNREDPSVTHEIVDRPAIRGKIVESREYLQPQWVFDCANARTLLPVERYAVGATLPPHLSPFVNNAMEGYTPEFAKEIEKYQSTSAARATRNDLKDASSSSESEEEEEEEQEEVLIGADDPSEEEEEEGSEEEEEEEEGEEEEEATAEKEEEVVPPKQLDAAEEELEMRKSMMSKKHRRLYGRMQYGIEKKQAHNQQLADRQEELKKKKRKAEGEAEAVVAPKKKKRRRK